MTPQKLSDRLWQFAARIGKVVDALPDTRVDRHVAGQVVRSGIAAAPNYDETGAGESGADFVHKVNVALKDDECDQLCRILGKSVSTAKGCKKRPLEVRPN